MIGRYVALWLAAVAVPAAAVPITQADLRVALPGTTSAANPALKGVVLADTLTPFSISDPKSGKTMAGTVQSRVVRRDSTATLDFYWRIIPAPGGNAAPFQFHIEDFFAANDPMDIDYRTDSLGSAGPINASWAKAFGIMEFILHSGCGGTWYCPSPPGGSRFFFAATSAKTFQKTAKMMIVASPALQVGFLPTYGPAAGRKPRKPPPGERPKLVLTPPPPPPPSPQGR
jgi:hypothetical protein